MILIWQWGFFDFQFEGRRSSLSRRRRRSAPSRFEKLAHTPEFLVALFDQHGGFHSEKLSNRELQNGIEQCSRSFMIQMSATLRLGDDFIDDAELAQIAGRNFE